MSDRRLLLRVAAPLVAAFLIGSWLLWTRGDASRQGGYCANATIEIAGVLRRADSSGDVGRGPLPPVDRILAQVGEVDVSRFQVDTPSEVRDDVDLLVAERDPAAFARIAEDYLTRCRNGSSG